MFFNGALPCDREQNFAQETEHPVTLTLEEADGTWKLCTDLYRYLPDVPASVISTKVLGEAFEPEQRFENPDGTPIVFKADYYGQERGIRPVPGPFAQAADDFVLI